MSAGDSNQYPDNQSGLAEPSHDTSAPPRWVEVDLPSLERIALLRSMTGEQRLKIAEQMFWTARKLKAAEVRQQHADWSEAEVTAEVTRIFLRRLLEESGDTIHPSLRDWLVQQGVEVNS